MLLAGCAGAVGDAPRAPAPRPAEPGWAAALPAGHTAWDNASLARVFVRLHFDTEWGGRRTRLLRHAEPVTLAVEGEGARAYRPFLARLADYLRRHAGIAVHRARRDATVTARLVPGPAFAAALPAAACVLVPGDMPWTAFAAAPSRLGGDAMLRLDRAGRMTVFVPRSAPPHAIRSCLIEEIVQALGPINDLYGLGPSIFNDDGAHVWPTRLDLLMLRVLHDPALEAGMSRSRAEAAARAVLEQLNPAGRAAPPLSPAGGRLTRPWRRKMEALLARGAERHALAAEAEAARALAARTLPGGPEHCHSLATLGRVLSRRAPERALAVLARAEALCGAVHGAGDVRLAAMAVEKAAALAALDRPGEALAALAGRERTLAGHAREERLAALYALRAEAYLRLGRTTEAEAARARARGWAAHAFGRGAGG
jgi:hypothetical protein